MVRFIKNILDVLNVTGSSMPLQPIVIDGWVEPSTFGLVANSRWDINGIDSYSAGTYNNIMVDTATYGADYYLHGKITSLSLLNGECHGLELNDSIGTLIFDMSFRLIEIDFRKANNLHTMVDYPHPGYTHIIYANAGDNADVKDMVILLISTASMPGIIHIPSDAYYYTDIATVATNYSWIIAP